MTKIRIIVVVLLDQNGLFFKKKFGYIISDGMPNELPYWYLQAESAEANFSARHGPSRFQLEKGTATLSTLCMGRK